MSIDTKFIGKKYPAYTYEVGREKLKEYARSIKNLDPHYLDDEFGKKSKYGSIIAPPTFAVVYGAYLVGPMFGDRELNLNMAMLVQGEQELEFYDVVRPGDVLTVEGVISDIKNKEKLDMISIEVNATNQDKKHVSKGTYTFVVRK